jgi:hypothetical protein
LILSYVTELLLVTFLERVYAMSEVDLSKALGDAESGKSTDAANPKKRSRKKGLPIPALPEGKRVFSGPVDVDPASQACPGEIYFSDPLHYWQTRVQYATKLTALATSEVDRLASQTPEVRTAERRKKLEKQAALRALKSDAVKDAIMKDSGILNTVFSALSPEQLAALQAQLQGLMAAKLTS